MGLPADDFVRHFGFCQQILRQRMGLRGDLPHRVVDVLSETSLDWLIEASLPLPDASWQSAGLLQLSGSLAAAMDFPRCLIRLRRAALPTSTLQPCLSTRPETNSMLRKMVLEAARARAPLSRQEGGTSFDLRVGAPVIKSSFARCHVLQHQCETCLPDFALASNMARFVLACPCPSEQCVRRYAGTRN